MFSAYHALYEIPHSVLSFGEGLGVPRIFRLRPELKAVKHKTASSQHTALHLEISHGPGLGLGRDIQTPTITCRHFPVEEGVITDPLNPLQ